MKLDSGDELFLFGLLFLIVANQLHDFTLLVGSVVIVLIGVVLNILHWIEEIETWLRGRKKEGTKST